MEFFAFAFLAILVLAAFVSVLDNFRNERRYPPHTDRRHHRDAPDDYYDHDDYYDPYRRRRPNRWVEEPATWRQPHQDRIPPNTLLLLLLLAGIGWMYIAGRPSSEGSTSTFNKEVGANTPPAPVQPSNIRNDDPWKPTSTQASTMPAPEPRYPHRESYVLVISTFNTESMAKTAMYQVAPLIKVPGYRLFVATTNRDRSMLYIPTRTIKEAHRLKAALEDNWEEVQRHCPDLPRIIRVDTL